MKSVGSSTHDGSRDVWVEVRVQDGFELEDLHADDRAALGIHAFVVPSALEDKMAAALAMGMLHWTVPIENVGVLSYEVTDGTQVLEPDRSVDWSELAFQYEGVLWERRKWS